MSCVRNPLFEFIASLWQGVISSTSQQNTSVEYSDERKMMKMSMIQHDLEHCHKELLHRFEVLQTKASDMLTQGREQMKKKEIAAAKRCVLSRRRLLSQMDLVNNSICALDNHLSVLEGMDLDMTVLRTLRASGHALKHMSIPGGMQAVDEIMSSVEEQINDASELAKAVSTGTLLNSDDIDASQLMLELELITETVADKGIAPPLMMPEQSSGMPEQGSVMPEQGSVMPEQGSGVPEQGSGMLAEDSFVV